jgi:glycosyltransferase involved in cell wall biosynthesis
VTTLTASQNTVEIVARQRIRLLFASQPLAEGVPQHVLDVVACLDRDQFEIEVACPRESILWRGLAGDPNVGLHALPASRHPSPRDAAALAKLIRLVRRADVVHVHSSKAGFLGRLAAAAGRQTRAVLFTPHAWSFWAASGALRSGYTGLERLAAHWCRTIVVVADAERRAALEARIGTPAQYRVVQNGIDTERFALPRRPVGGRVIAVGRLARQKRPDLLVHAAARLRDRHPEIEVLLVGEGPERPAVERLVSELGLGGQVQLLGNREDVPELLATAEAAVLASDYEGCPLSVLEAMAAGVPVVATHVGGVPEILADGSTGRLVEPGQPEALAAAIGDLLDDPVLRDSLGSEARRVARERFTRERMSAELAALYETHADR